MADHTLRIGITGSYGGLNLGDEAILESIISQLRSSMAVDITVFSRNAEDTRRRHRVERSVPVRELTREESKAEVRRLDLLLFGGGGILYDREAEVYLREVLLAHECEVPVMVYAVSAGPLRQRGSRQLVAEALGRAALITVRDRQARRVLEDIGLHGEIHVTADPALLLSPSPLPPETLQREGLDHARGLVGFSVREPGPAAPEMDVTHYHALLANAADFIVQRWEADVVFVPMERGQMDMQHSHAVAARMKYVQRASVLKGEYTPGELMTLIGHFQFAVGMRLHFLIFAALQGVPFVALPYANKVAGLLQDLDMDMPSLDDVNVGGLIATIDQSWDLRDQLKARIGSRMGELQERARQTHALLLRLLAERRPLKRTAGPGS